MLANDFYKVLERDTDDQQLNIRIELNPAHDIFKGHFPNNPVTPGVCMLQIFKELIEDHLQLSLLITECTNVKFMAIINPQIHPFLNLSINCNAIDDNAFKVKASATFESTNALKLSMTLKQIE